MARNNEECANLSSTILARTGQQPIAQLMVYAPALSRRTGLRLY
jgi:hypothetical protein